MSASAKNRGELPIPNHFDPRRVGELWRVDYAALAPAAEAWARRHGIGPASEDEHRTCLLLIDMQNTFCLPGYELFVGGRSGTGAVDDNVRLCRFLYRSLGAITTIHATLDTHVAFQIFHPAFWVDASGDHPEPMTAITVADVESGRWRVNPLAAEEPGATLPAGWTRSAAPPLGKPPADRAAELSAYALHYVRELAARSKYDLMVWPYHAMLGGPSHALVSAVHEAMFFHTVARASQSRHHVKGSLPLTEHYSVLGPEVDRDHHGRPLADRAAGSTQASVLLETLLAHDRVIVAGQAKSHCLAWTIEDLLGGLRAHDPGFARKVFLLEDCTSPVVVPGAVDFTAPADEAFERFVAAGMHVVRSTEPLATWPAP